MIKSRYPAFPYIAFMAIFIIVPLIMVAYFAFTSSSGEFTMQNIIRVGDYVPVIIKSLFLAFVATLICLLLGYPFAYIMANKTSNIRRTMFMLIMLPMWMNFLIRTYSWITILSNNGVLNTFFDWMGLEKIQLINTPVAVILGMVYNYIPYMILPIYSVMCKIDTPLLEAADDLGSNGFMKLKKIIFPMSIPGIVSGITMVFVPAVSTFYISQKLGGGKTLLIGDAIESQFMSANTYNLGASLSLVLMVMILISMFIMNKFADEDGGVLI